MIIKVDESGIRIDKYLSDKIDLSRSKIQKLIDSGNILVNKNMVSNNYKVNIDDVIEISEFEDDSLNNLKPCDKEIDVIYEDDDLLVINKESGMVVDVLRKGYMIKDKVIRPAMVKVSE